MRVARKIYRTQSHENISYLGIIPSLSPQGPNCLLYVFIDIMADGCNYTPLLSSLPHSFLTSLLQRYNGA